VPDLIAKSFDRPDERREFPFGFLDLITVRGTTMGRETLEPGWKWSTHIRPISGTERCEFRHVGFQISGRWVCESRDGSQIEIGPGEIYDVAPGHDSWVVGDEPAVAIDFQGIADWAASPGSGQRVLTTLLFTDIVGSTAIAEGLGDAAWKRILRTHKEDNNVLLGRFGGTLVDTAGDGALSRFDSPAQALRCALSIVDAARRLQIEVRAGAHTAEVELVDGNPQGVGVHLAARIMAAAAASEVLVSATTRDLAAGTELGFVEKGTFDLKGITGARTLYSIGAESRPAAE